MSGKRSAGPWFTPARRGQLYRVAAAAGALAAFYGLVSADALPLWLGLAATTLGNVQAAAYTPAGGKDSGHD